MAESGLINKLIYEIKLRDIDVSSLRTGRQVRVTGTHIYLVYIFPNPINKTRQLKTQSRVRFETLKTKKKTVIGINEEDLTAISIGHGTKIGSFLLTKETQI
jgi:hypothetical protein